MSQLRQRAREVYLQAVLLAAALTAVAVLLPARDAF